MLDAGPRTVASGLVLGESPRWHEGRLWVADWGAQRLVAIDPAGDVEVLAHVPGIPVSLDRLPDGRLLIGCGRRGRLMRREADGGLAIHADLAAISPHPWHDLVVDGRGNAYLGNTGFPLPDGDFAPGSIALVTPDGAARTVADGLAFPNGLAVTPDNRTLIAAESYGRRLTAYEIADDGSLSPGRVWALLGDGVPDGICLDAEGAAWYADVPNRRCVRVREGGEVLATVEADRGCFACMLGGGDGRTLFIAAARWTGAEGLDDEMPTGVVLAVDAPAPHAGWP